MPSYGAAAFSEAFTRLVDGAAGPDPPPARLLGLEHEYSVFAEGRGVDFQQLIHSLPVPGQRLDPGDRNAYRCRSGLALTSDGREAEIASPPLAVEPGFATAIEDWALTGQRGLHSILPPGTELGGYSTHLSASMPAALNDRACKLFCLTFAPVLALLVDGPDSWGVYVRPRPNRLEFCGEYVAGRRLGAAAAFVAGAARACADAVSGDGSTPPRLPPILDVQLMPALGRYGLFVGRRTAFGFDLYKAGRQAALPRLNGATITAQEQLEIAWEAARASLTGTAGKTDLAAAAAIVAGSQPLGTEDPTPTAANAGRPRRSPVYGAVVAMRGRPGFAVSAAIATWSFNVFRLEGPGRTAYACVPRRWFASFLDQLEAGALDGVIGAFLDAAPLSSRLIDPDQTQQPGLWDELGSPRALLAAERQPAYWHGASGAGETDRIGKDGRPGKAIRPGKLLLPVPPPPIGPPPPPAAPVTPAEEFPWKFVLPIGAAVVAVAVTFAVLAAGGIFGGGAPPAAETPTHTPTPSSTLGPSETPSPTAVIVLEPTTAPAHTTTPSSTVSPSATPTPTAVNGQEPTAQPTGTTGPTATASPAPILTPTTKPSSPPTATPAPTPTATPAPTPTATPAPTPTATPAPTASPSATPDPGLVSILGSCDFSPSSLTRPQGSTVTFSNQTAVTVTILIAAPLGGTNTNFPLSPNQQSNPYTLTVPGTYFIECTGGGSGGMQITSV